MSSTWDDVFDQLSDPFTGIDWDTVPGLFSVAPTPQPADLPQPRHSTPSLTLSQTNEEDPYPYDEVDAAFLAEIDQVERRLLPPPIAGSGGESSHAAERERDRKPEEAPTSSDKFTSRYFHSENIFRYS